MLVSDTTKALLRKKLVSKKTNKDDQRSFFIELTDEGKSICNKAVKLIEVLDDEFFALTGNTKNFHEMLHRIESRATILKK
jgi:DNA-binding MarR family transcriptional regulator